MGRNVMLFDAYTNMTPLEKRAVMRFLCQHAGNVTQENIQEALDYALKRKPSFGGYVIVAYEEEDIVAAMVVNQTGMEGYNSKYIIVYLVLHEKYQDDDQFFQELLKKAIHYANGDVAIHVRPDNSNLKLYQKLGFKTEFLELRLNEDDSVSTASK